MLYACLVCLLLFSLGGIITFSQRNEILALFADEVKQFEPTVIPPASVTRSPLKPAPTPEESQQADSLSAQPEQKLSPSMIPSPSISLDEASLGLNQADNNLLTLLNADYPPRDYFEGAARLGRVEVGPRTVEAINVKLGDMRAFYSDDGQHEAILSAITEHTYFWVETSLAFDEKMVALAASRFEKEIYPGLSQIFGTEWQPGIDNDTRFSILHLDGYGDDTDLGFFNKGDEYPRTVNEKSNEMEIIYLNMRNLIMGEDLYFGTLVHEYQHLMQWNADNNETVWLSEGLAQFAELYSGLNTADSDLDYWSNPDVQLNSWEYENEDELFAHYGAAYLFVVYFW